MFLSPFHQRSDHAKALLVQNTASQTQTLPLALRLGVITISSSLRHVTTRDWFFIICRSGRRIRGVLFVRPLSVTLPVTSSPSLPISTKLGEGDKLVLAEVGLACETGDKQPDTR